MFEFRTTAQRLQRAPWLASALLHGLVIAVAFGLSLHATRPQRQTTFIALEPPSNHAPRRMPAYKGNTGRGVPGTAAAKAAVPAAVAPAAVAAPPAPAPVVRPDSTPTTSVAAAVAAAAFPRSASDPRIWATPRPSLPKDVAEALYIPKDTSIHRDTVVARRLRALVDSMNRLFDIAEREHKAPSWTTEVGGMKFGMDSANIYIAGLKIPTPVLALLGSNLPQGNFDEAMRDKAMADIRRDMMQAAQRAKTMDEFNHYVRELRARKQAERDAERRQRDTTHHTGPDTVRVVQ